MSQLPIIELCISLVLVYFVLSVLVSAIGEVVNTVLQRRSKLLFEAIRKAFDQGEKLPWGTLLYQHPLIANMKRKADRLPSYISSSVFSSALVAVIIEEYEKKRKDVEESADPGKSFGKMWQAIGEMEDGDVKKLLVALANECTDMETFRAKLSRWYDEYMERVSGWFTRKTKVIIAIISAAVVITFNIDTIRIATEIWNNQALRASLVLQAEKTAANHELASELRDYREIFSQDTALLNQEAWDELKVKVDSVVSLNSQIARLGLPIGWKGATLTDHPYPSPFWNFMQMLLGWVITTFALTAGAPFWFKTLGKLVNMRNTG